MVRPNWRMLSKLLSALFFPASTRRASAECQVTGEISFLILVLCLRLHHCLLLVVLCLLPSFYPPTPLFPPPPPPFPLPPFPGEGRRFPDLGQTHSESESGNAQTNASQRRRRHRRRYRRRRRCCRSRREPESDMTTMLIVMD